MVLLGLHQPFTGMIADKFGAARVLIGSALDRAASIVAGVLKRTARRPRSPREARGPLPPAANP